MFNALVLEQEDKKTTASVCELNESTLAESEVLVAVSYSSINYKDALAVTGKGRIIRNFPMVPGVDFVIVSSSLRIGQGGFQECG